eukprot:272207_1
MKIMESIFAPFSKQQFALSHIYTVEGYIRRNRYHSIPQEVKDLILFFCPFPQLNSMHIYRTRKSIVICMKLGITNTYHYKVQIPAVAETKFKRLLDCWRTNTLFDQVMINGSVKILPSRMCKLDPKIPPIKDISAHNKTQHHINRNRNNDDSSDTEDDDKHE